MTDRNEFCKWVVFSMNLVLFLSINGQDHKDGASGASLTEEKMHLMGVTDDGIKGIPIKNKLKGPTSTIGTFYWKLSGDTEISTGDKNTAIPYNKDNKTVTVVYLAGQQVVETTKFRKTTKCTTARPITLGRDFDPDSDGAGPDINMIPTDNGKSSLITKTSHNSDVTEMNTGPTEHDIQITKTEFSTKPKYNGPNKRYESSHFVDDQ